MNSSVFAFLLIGLLLNSCFTPKKEREIKDEIFALKTKIIELERSDNEKGQTVDSSRKNLAATHTELERVNIELQRIRGDIETLKVAVNAGELPGSEAEDSVAKKVRAIDERVTAIEATLAEKSIAANKTSAGASTATNSEGRVAVADIRKAFNSKQFSFVAENADSVLKRLKTKQTKEEISYFEAESLYRLNRCREAAIKFNDYAEQFADMGRIAHAKLRLGDCFKQLGDSLTAKSFYNELISKFPKSEEAKQAKSQLKKL